MRHIDNVESIRNGKFVLITIIDGIIYTESFIRDGASVYQLCEFDSDE
jgi:hypothetical protein